ncbi:MAG: hypothetical protein U5L04_09475 [Trueperaceae bacterium]|nr:hypothetical protein [Trueperaceae bacterium]
MNRSRALSTLTIIPVKKRSTPLKNVFLALGFLLVTGLLSACNLNLVVDQGYVLSGSLDQDTGFVVDNIVDVYLNGVVVESRTSDGREEVSPIYFEANQGDELVLRVRNRDFLSDCRLDQVYLRDSLGNSISVTSGFSATLCDTGVVFTSRSLTIPF